MSKENLQVSELISGGGGGDRILFFWKSPHIVRMHMKPLERASQQRHHSRLVDACLLSYIFTIESCTDEPINAGLTDWLKIPLRLRHSYKSKILANIGLNALLTRFFYCCILSLTI